MNQKTPIEHARNLSDLTGGELRGVGIETLEDLRRVGWREACLMLVSENPQRINLNAFTAIIGAEMDLDWRNVDPKLKEEARQMIKAMKS